MPDPTSGKETSVKYVTFVDQCVVSKICDNAGVPWQTTDVGSILDKALSNGKMSVRVTPENIAETLLCRKFDDNGNLDKGHGA
jgi:hypothetical protein